MQWRAYSPSQNPDWSLVVDECAPQQGAIASTLAANATISICEGLIGFATSRIAAHS
jgi:hypothetical protein